MAAPGLAAPRLAGARQRLRSTRGTAAIGPSRRPWPCTPRTAWLPWSLPGGLAEPGVPGGDRPLVPLWHAQADGLVLAEQADLLVLVAEHRRPAGVGLGPLGPDTA